MWPFTKRAPQGSRPAMRAGSWSVADPAMAAYFGYNPGDDFSWVSERTALGLSAFWRAGSLLSGTIATLPVVSYRERNGDREIVSSWLDDPGRAVDLTPFEWKEQVVWHQFLGGDAFLYHLWNGAGTLAGALPIHPRCVTVDWITDADRQKGLQGRKKYGIQLVDGTFVNGLDNRSITQIMGPSLDGLRGMSVITVANISLNTAIAGDRAAYKMFKNGGMISAIATPDEDLDEADDVSVIEADLNSKIAGADNAARVAVINRRMKITPWSMSATDAEFLAQRQFSIEEVARWTGVPPHLLMQTDKQTSWGTGVAEQNLGLRQYNLGGYTSRMEGRFDRLTPKGQVSRFDFTALERPSPKDEADLAIRKYEGGLATRNEARQATGLPRVDGGDVFKDATAQSSVAAPTGDGTQIEDGDIDE